MTHSTITHNITNTLELSNSKQIITHSPTCPFCFRSFATFSDSKYLLWAVFLKRRRLGLRSQGLNYTYGRFCVTTYFGEVTCPQLSSRYAMAVAVSHEGKLKHKHQFFSKYLKVGQCICCCIRKRRSIVRMTHVYPILISVA